MEQDKITQFVTYIAIQLNYERWTYAMCTNMIRVFIAIDIFNVHIQLKNRFLAARELCVMYMFGFVMFVCLFEVKTNRV